MAAKLIPTESFSDTRGDLLVGEFPKNIPFAPVRFFVVSGVPNRESRGHHAHRTNQQILYCLDGKVNVRVHDGRNWNEFVLESGSEGLYIPALHWGEQFYQSEKTKLLVIASEQYSAEEYISSFNEFLNHSR